MDSRLQRVGGDRLAHLRYSDAPKVAQAIVDAIDGRARVLSGQSHDTAYVQFVRDKSYSIAIRRDDWRKIFPFFRYSAAAYRPVIPPSNQPPPVVSPQPNRTMQQPPENPAGGLKSFLDGLPFPEYSKIQKLLTVLAFKDFEKPSSWARTSVYTDQNATSLIPQEQRKDFSELPSNALYNKLVHVLQQLFPVDFPTTY